MSEVIGKEVILFPVNFDRMDDVVITRMDLEGSHISLAKVDLLAKALQVKRARLGKLEGEDRDEFGGHMPNWPEVTLSIDYGDLSEFEPLSIRLMREAGILPPECCRSIEPIDLTRVNKILKRAILRYPQKPVYELGFRRGRIVVADTTDKKYPLQIGEHVYEILSPYGKGLHNGSFPNEVLIQIAAAGLKGLRVSKLIHDYPQRAIDSRAYRTREYLEGLGFPSLKVECRFGRLYFFDSEQPAHLRKYKKLSRQVTEAKRLIFRRNLERKRARHAKPPRPGLNPTVPHSKKRQLNH